MAIATLEQAIEGTDNNALMTPYLTASSLSARLNYIRLLDDKYIQLGLDPSGVNDSSAALMQAYADAVGKQQIVIGKGTFMQSSRITIGSSDLQIIYENGSKIVAAPSVYAPDTLYSAINRDNLTFENINAIGNGSLPSGAGGSSPQAFYFTGCNNIRLIDTKLSNFTGTGLVLNGCIDGSVIGGNFKTIGQDVTGLPHPFGASPAVYVGYGSRRIKIRDVHFEDCKWSGIFLFADYSDVVDCSFLNIGESAVYSESINPSGNNGVEIRYNRYAGNKVQGTRIKDISSCGLEILTSDTIIEGNTLIDCGTHGIAVGCSSRVFVRGNIIGNANANNQDLNAGIIATVHSGVYNAAASQGDQITIEGNQIYDERNLMRSGIQWHSLDTSNYVFRRSIDVNNTFCGLPIGKERIITPQAIVDDPTLSYGPVFGPDSAWKSSYRALPGYSWTTSLVSTNLKSTSIPSSYMLNSGAIRIKASGDFANGNNVKTIQLKFGGAIIGTVSSITPTSWDIECDIINNAYNAQTIIFRSSTGVTSRIVTFSNGAFNTVASMTIEINGLVVHPVDYSRCVSLSAERI